MRRTLVLTVFTALAPALLAAQAPIPPADQQIAVAVLPLPAEFRADATVLGYSPEGKLVTLRDGKGAMTCLADDPKEEKAFHVACYHKSMEPFMARGRALRASGVTGDKVDSVRFKEVKAGKIRMPKQAALWSLSGDASVVDMAAGKVTPAARALYVVYMPYATPATSGIPAAPVRGAPWVMYPGTPKAHIMFVPSM
ncbi:MAG: hypothetical protein ABIZ70_07325 [Gemmatimonadales bacterium]